MHLVKAICFKIGASIFNSFPYLITVYIVLKPMLDWENAICLSWSRWPGQVSAKKEISQSISGILSTDKWISSEKCQEKKKICTYQATASQKMEKIKKTCV